MRVERSGLSANAYITQCVFDRPPPRQTRRPPVEKQDLARLLCEAAAIRDRLEEIAVTDSADSHALLFEAACEDLAELRAAVLRLMGRKP